MKKYIGWLAGCQLYTDSDLPRNELHLVNRQTRQIITIDLGPAFAYEVTFPQADGDAGP